RHALGRQSMPFTEAAHLVVRDQSGNVERIMFEEQLDASFVDEIPVLDRADAERESTVDGFRGIGMRSDIAIGHPSLIYDRRYFVFRVLKRIDPIRLRADSSGESDLDMVRAQSQLTARGATHLGHTVSDVRHRKHDGAVSRTHKASL